MEPPLENLKIQERMGVEIESKIAPIFFEPQKHAISNAISRSRG